MWYTKLIVGFILVASLSGIANASNSKAAMKDASPTPLRVSHELGYRLAVDPRVTYPPQDVNCWHAEYGPYPYQCSTYLRTVTKHWWTERDTTYGVKVRVYEDGSWVIRKYAVIALASQTTYRG